MKTQALLIIAVLLSACGPGIPITKVSEPAARQLNQSVRVVEAKDIPAGARSLGQIEATSCKHMAWDATPTNENAIIQMKALAKQRGATVLANVYCEPPVGVSYGPDCWSHIRCTSTAYQM
jgi:Flp pilus assembly protein CpaB